MTPTIGINGFGRIGRSYLRIALERDMNVVAINDLTDTRTLAHLLKYDSTYGRLGQSVTYDDTSITVGDRRIAATAEKDPSKLDWGKAGVDVVIEATGRFRDRDSLALHLKAGARKVLLSVPGKGVDLTVVMGINETDYDPITHDIVSNASCTTNCVAPMAAVLHNAFVIERALMTTVHGYTGDQNLLDGPHKDLRRARSAAISIIPTSTGAARATGIVVPELAGLIDGLALRVPVPDGSLTDLTALVGTETTAEDVNEAFRTASRDRLAGVLRVEDDPIVSHDVVGDPASCIIDASLTLVAGRLVKVFGWYDNEWAYSSRLADLTSYVGATL